MQIEPATAEDNNTFTEWRKCYGKSVSHLVSGVADFLRLETLTL